MKKIVLTSLLLSLSLLVASPVLALYQPEQGQRGQDQGRRETSPSPENEAPDQNKRFSITQEQKPNLNQSTGSAQRVKERVQQHLVQVHATRLRRRFSFYYQRLSSLGEKLQERINLAQTEGLKTQLAQEKLNLAFTHLEAAKLKADGAVDQFETIDPNQYQLQRRLALQARDLAQDARSEFKLAKDAMIESVRALANQDMIDETVTTQPEENL